MKDTTRSTDLMYARLKKVHKLSHTGLDGTEKLLKDDYLFFLNLWYICDNMKEWDKLVEKFKQLNGYEK